MHTHWSNLTTLSDSLTQAWRLKKKQKETGTQLPGLDIACGAKSNDWGLVIDRSKDVVSLGRAPDNDIVIVDFSVSRAHAVITRNKKGQYEITDLSSTNGTFVNGVKVHESSKIFPGDDIRIGPVWEFVFQIS